MYFDIFLKDFKKASAKAVMAGTELPLLVSGDVRFQL